MAHSEFEQLVNQKASARFEALENTLAQNREWFTALLPHPPTTISEADLRDAPRKGMQLLVREIQQHEGAHAVQLRAVSKRCLAKLFGLQRMELLENISELTKALDNGVPQNEAPVLSSSKSRSLLKELQRAYSIVEGIGLKSQELYLSRLRREEPELFEVLEPLYRKFMTITQHGFFLPVPQEAETVMGLGSGKGRFKIDGELHEQRFVPKRVEFSARILHAPIELLWINEAAELLTHFELRAVTSKLATLPQAEQSLVVRRLESLKLRNIRYQQGLHVLEVLGPLFGEAAYRYLQASGHSWNLKRTVQAMWGRFFSLPISKQDSLVALSMKRENREAAVSKLVEAIL